MAGRRPADSLAPGSTAETKRGNGFPTKRELLVQSAFAAPFVPLERVKSAMKPAVLKTGWLKVATGAAKNLW